MKENIGTVDRTLRTVIGIALLLAGWLGPDGAIGIVLVVVGLVLLVTGLFSHCPLYSILNKETCEKPDPRGH